MIGEITTSTTYDNHQRCMMEPFTRQKGAADFNSVYDTGMLPVQNFIRFLEAISLEVWECGFYREAKVRMGECVGTGVMRVMAFSVAFEANWT